jgi:tRNA (cmo5U34)-methyltransferase
MSDKMEIPEHWTFKDKGVAEGFNKHVREQLPWYDLATSAVEHIARHYVPEKGTVYDFGASTGNIGKALSDILAKRKAEMIAVDNSQEMANLYAGPGKLVVADMATMDIEPYDVAVCFLVLMFLPPAEQAAFIQKLRDKARPGGAIIIMDKEKAISGYAATVLWRMTLAGKVSAGVPADEIIKKELSLSGVQRPIDRKILGEDAVPFFKYGEFSGWLIET